MDPKQVKTVAGEFLDLITKRTLLIGIGNDLKGDDGVGIVLLDRIRGKVDAEFLDCGIAPENYLEKIVKLTPRTIIVIDAVDLNEEPGSIRIIRPEILDGGGINTHSLSPRVFIEYLQARLEGTEVFILGIQPGSCCLGDGLSSAVNGAITSFLSNLH